METLVAPVAPPRRKRRANALKSKSADGIASSGVVNLHHSGGEGKLAAATELAVAPVTKPKPSRPGQPPRYATSASTLSPKAKADKIGGHARLTERQSSPGPSPQASAPSSNRLSSSMSAGSCPSSAKKWNSAKHRSEADAQQEDILLSPTIINSRDRDTGIYLNVAPKHPGYRERGTVVSSKGLSTTTTAPRQPTDSIHNSALGSVSSPPPIRDTGIYLNVAPKAPGHKEEGGRRTSTTNGDSKKKKNISRTNTPMPTPRVPPWQKQQRDTTSSEEGGEGGKRNGKASSSSPVLLNPASNHHHQSPVFYSLQREPKSSTASSKKRQPVRPAPPCPKQKNQVLARNKTVLKQPESPCEYAYADPNKFRYNTQRLSRELDGLDLSMEYHYVPVGVVNHLRTPPQHPEGGDGEHMGNVAAVSSVDDSTNIYTALTRSCERDDIYTVPGQQSFTGPRPHPQASNSGNDEPAVYMNIKSKHVERSKSFTISTSHHHASPQDEMVRSTSSDGSDFSESIYAPISEETRQEDSVYQVVHKHQ